MKNIGQNNFILNTVEVVKTAGLKITRLPRPKLALNITYTSRKQK